MSRILLTLVICLIFAQPSWAQTLRYEGTFAALPVLEVEARLESDAGGYRFTMHTRSVGISALFSRTEHWLEAQGGWRRDVIVPQHYQTHGFWHGETREIVIDYHDGAPQVQRLVPLVDEPREAVPDALRVTGVDALSAIMQMLRQFQLSHSCAGTLPLFDGRRFARAVAVDLAPDRCLVEVIPLAGWPKGATPTDSYRLPWRMQMWMAQPPGAAFPVPVRIEAEMRWLGHVKLQLSRIE